MSRYTTCAVQNQSPEDDRPPARPREARRTSPHLTSLSLVAAAIATGLFEGSIEIEQMFHNAFYRPSRHKQAPFLTVIFFFYSPSPWLVSSFPLRQKQNEQHNNNDNSRNRREPSRGGRIDLFFSPIEKRTRKKTKQKKLQPLADRSTCRGWFYSQQKKNKNKNTT